MRKFFERACAVCPPLAIALCVAAFLLLAPTIGWAVEWATGNFWLGFEACMLAGIAETAWLIWLLESGDKA